MKHLQKILIASLCVICAVSAYAQVETVYLKNGSVIHGIIIEQRPGESLKLQTRDGNIFVYQLSDVEKITKESDEVKSNYSFHGGVAPGYRGFAEIGYGIGLGYSDTGRMDFTTLVPVDWILPLLMVINFVRTFSLVPERVSCIIMMHR
ncbi:MAG: hypothetical protein K2M94_01865 [Paramuribaculum sp.]|nr:hypothetical protein [Paramuribaculum sp.]